MSSNPGTEYWMDIFFTYLFVVKFVMFEKKKITEKEAEVGPFRKTNKLNRRSSVQ